MCWSQAATLPMGAQEGMVERAPDTAAAGSGPWRPRGRTQELLLGTGGPQRARGCAQTRSWQLLLSSTYDSPRQELVPEGSPFLQAEEDAPCKRKTSKHLHKEHGPLPSSSSPGSCSVLGPRSRTLTARSSLLVRCACRHCSASEPGHVPTGAPNAAETPAAAPAETKSLFSVSLRKYSKI